MRFVYLDDEEPEPGLRNVDAAAQALLDGKAIVVSPDEVCGRESELSDLLDGLGKRGIAAEVRLHPETQDVYVARVRGGPSFGAPS